jgi:phenylacetate-coenzyme A ligase PaaK-like adenylate-forming protein
MEQKHLEKVTPLLVKLLRLTQSWAQRRKLDLEKAARLRQQILLINHDHYMRNIPAYRRFVEEEGLVRVETVQTIKQNLMISDDFFKSYNQAWLDDCSFDQMNNWLSQILHRRVEFDTTGIHSIDSWIDRLGQHGVQLVYSSGTSGSFSFVPRDQESWDFFISASSS